MAKKTQKPKIDNDFMIALSKAEFLYAFASVYGLPEQKGYCEVNKDMANEQGNAVRITDAGRQYVASLNASEPVKENSTMDFEIFDAPAAPARKRAGRAGGSAYPFDKLEVGKAFFVPATEERANPAKSLSSLVAKASRNYATESGTKTTAKGKVLKTWNYSRRFAIYPGEKSDGTKGAWISRTM